MTTYHRLCTEFYDLDKANAPEQALEFYLRYAREARGPIWEPMCGSGRFLLPMLQEGLDIDGSDTSEFMLDACRRRARELGLQPRLYQQKLEEAALPRRYALVFVPSGSIGLISRRDELMAGLRKIREHMLSGAKLILEIELPISKESHSVPYGGRWLKRPDGATLLLTWLGQYDAAERLSSNLHRYEVIEHGRIVACEIEDFTVRMYDSAEFCDILATAGFTGMRELPTYGAHQYPPDDAPPVVVECVNP